MASTGNSSNTHPLFDLDVIGEGLVFADSLPELDAALTTHRAAVVQAPPGTGKTTLVPPAVANHLASANAGAPPGRIIVTQPRRVAARAAAHRLTQLTGTTLGEHIGYTVRGDSHTSAATIIEFVTPGILVRRLLTDPMADGTAAIILDEVHERHLETDLLLALTGETQQVRDDLTIIAMSATVDAPTFARLLASDGTEFDRGAGSGNGGTGLESLEPVPHISSATALHPLTITYTPHTGDRIGPRGVETSFLNHIATTALATHREALATNPETDALVFAPGAREVDHITQQLRAAATDIDVLPLHGQLPAQLQDHAIRGRQPGGKPRIIVSTTLAESSLTVPGVHLVIDSGLTREPRRDATRGMSGLVTVSASQASAEQRAGRAARLGPGTAIRCYSERTHAAAPAHITPEITTADLTETTLTLAAWGAPRGHNLRWINPPPAAALNDAEKTLQALNAIDSEGRITDHGRTLASIPLNPRWAHALVDNAARYRAEDVAAVIAVATGEQRIPGANLPDAIRHQQRDPHRPTQRETQRLTRLAHKHGGAGEGVGEGSAHGAAHTSAAELAGIVTATAWPDRIAKHMGEGVYLLASGTRAALPPDATLGRPEWLAIADVTRAHGHAAAGTGAIIRAAAPLTTAEATSAAGNLAGATTRITITPNGTISARNIEAIGAIELRATPTKPNPAQAAEALAEHLTSHGLNALTFNTNATALRNRLAFLHHHIGDPWPAMSDRNLAASVTEWLGPELNDVAHGASLKTIDLTEPLRRLLPWPEAANLDELAPARITLPSGNTAAIKYPDASEYGDGDGVSDDAVSEGETSAEETGAEESSTAQTQAESPQPVVAAKLQETFGWTETPCLAGGRAPVLFHLLSPAGRPLAVTSDLHSFFTGPYADVRAEMRGRYPKHPWPEDPLTAQPTHLTNRKLREK
ncbi:ATP-dependent helicase C-terminal domain-containing protein [Pseudoglutamicibacter cumminsii]|uniref:RNA helicase n=1 Tax=Pseudoglutamicibacter cumminsii TaxID=156979 RepID=A0AAP4C626_9MICC|nr:ATP-dependent helicase C-terminal domain-containing protein [Pseudoglutamicibacter cumminsii]MDK6274681.1 ATP-dependent helicase C-terminal domain-containing protein [Pseudoglutamicibacter cumminsii]